MGAGVIVYDGDKFYNIDLNITSSGGIGAAVIVCDGRFYNINLNRTFPGER